LQEIDVKLLWREAARLLGRPEPDTLASDDAT
jgi:hypothetical protein